jgi:hypothetical protein
MSPCPSARLREREPNAAHGRDRLETLSPIQGETAVDGPSLGGLSRERRCRAQGDDERAAEHSEEPDHAGTLLSGIPAVSIALSHGGRPECGP